MPIEQQEHCALLKQTSTSTTTTTTTTEHTTTSMTRTTSIATISENTSQKTPKVLNQYNSKASFDWPRESTKNVQPVTTDRPKLLLNNLNALDESEKEKGLLDESLENVDLNSFILNEILNKNDLDGALSDPKSTQFSLENMALSKQFIFINCFKSVFLY